MITALARRRETAVTISDDRRFHLRLDKEEAARRFRATPFLCDVAAMALEEGAYTAADRLLAPVFGWRGGYALNVASFPGYTRIRNFLVGELDADEIVACRVAARRVALFNRHISHYPERRHCRGDLGWL